MYYIHEKKAIYLNIFYTVFTVQTIEKVFTVVLQTYYIYND